jgi:hypothetical protein
MAWKTRITERMAEWLGFFGWGAFLVNGIILAIGSVWFVGKLVWFFCRFLNRTLFKSPW